MQLIAIAAGRNLAIFFIETFPIYWKFSNIFLSIKFALNYSRFAAKVPKKSFERHKGLKKRNGFLRVVGISGGHFSLRIKNSYNLLIHLDQHLIYPNPAPITKYVENLIIFYNCSAWLAWNREGIKKI